MIASCVACSGRFPHIPGIHPFLALAPASIIPRYASPGNQRLAGRPPGTQPNQYSNTAERHGTERLVRLIDAFARPRTVPPPMILRTKHDAVGNAKGGASHNGIHRPIRKGNRKSIARKLNTRLTRPSRTGLAPHTGRRAGDSSPPTRDGEESPVKANRVPHPLRPVMGRGMRHPLPSRVSYARLRERSANAAPRPASSMPARAAGRTPRPVEARGFSLTVTVSFGLRASP